MLRTSPGVSGVPIRCFRRVFSTCRPISVWGFFCVLAVGALASSCGGGGDATPTTPATPPAPTTPAPPPPATPTGPHITRIEILSGGRDDLTQPHELGGRIEVEIQFRGQGLVVEGSPSLAIEIGQDIRFAALSKIDSRPNEGLSYLRFRYRVAEGDHDPDGISIREGALSLDGGSIKDVNGNDADLTIGDYAIDNDPRLTVSAEMISIAYARMSSSPSDYSTGYIEDDYINVYVRWKGDIRIDGIPYFSLDIGEHSRPAAMVQYTKTDIIFRYIVQRDDHDADGLGFSDDAIELVNGSSIVSAVTGEPVQLELDEWAVENDDFHKVRPHDPFPAPRDCSIERREALEYALPAAITAVVAEWDGTPIRVDIVDNFPSFVTHDDLRELLAPIGIAADKIEEELGYRILEMGDIIPVPRGAPSGWDQNYDRFELAGQFGRPPLLPREEHQLLAFYMNDDEGFWDHFSGSPMVSFPWSGATSFNKRTMGDWWYNKDDCCIGRWSGNGRDGHMIIHEVFHLLGFRHPDEPNPNGVLMAWGSTIAPWHSGSRVHYVAHKDIEVLKCVFPRR